MKLPFLIMGFNRPHHLSQVLESLPKNRVSTLYVSLDGPRNSDDLRKIELIIQELESKQFSFDVQVKSQERNLGCALGVVTGLDWFFSQVDNGIVLEDDCLIDEDFVNFVTSHHETIGSINRIGIISAHNPMRIMNESKQIYSRYMFINGWYSTSEIWSAVRKDFFKKTLPKRKNQINEKQTLSESIFWWSTATRARHGKHDTWDSPFSARMYQLGYKSLVPRENLVENIGFDDSATHTKNTNGTIFIDEKKMNPKLAREDFDQYLASNYFKISWRHIFTPWINVAIDHLFTRKRRNEEIIKHSASEARYLQIKGKM